MYQTYEVDNPIALRAQAFTRGVELIFVGTIFAIAGIKLIESAVSDEF